MKAVKLEVFNRAYYLVLHEKGRGLLMSFSPGGVYPDWWGTVCECCCGRDFKNEIESAAAAHGVTEVLYEGDASRLIIEERHFLTWELEWMSAEPLVGAE